MDSGAIAGSSSSRSPPLPYSSSSYAPLPYNNDGDEATSSGRSSSARWRVLVAAGVVVVLLVVATGFAGVRMEREAAAAGMSVMERGRARKAAGVSEKTSGVRLGTADAGADHDGFPWSNAMLQWQRTGFHFQPHKNWMNGPVYYKGWYHLFYQYNPEGAVWGNIAWGHAVSRDLLRWHHLPLAMVPDQWYDINGVWTGSATVLLPNNDGGDNIVILYTGSTNESMQVQCLAVPSDPDNDPLLIKWRKYEGNPVMYPPAGVDPKDFRDPTTAWFDPSDRTWRLVIGSKDDTDHAGIAMVYKTRDFVNYDLVTTMLHRVAGTGMWECVDLYPVSATGGIDMSDAISSISNDHNEKKKKKKNVVVLKASMDDDRHDYYAVGHYDAAANTWTPVDPDKDVGIIGGLRYDWGKLYASKTFYDPAKRRRVLWGWVGETDSQRADKAKGWASLQSIPRTVVLDGKSENQLTQWPVEEVETLRVNSTDLSGITVDPGSVIPLVLNHRATQLDIIAEFHLTYNSSASAAMIINDDDDDDYSCSAVINRGALGPFGLLVLADKQRHERTAVYFYVVVSKNNNNKNKKVHFCHDESRSSRADDILKQVVGASVAVFDHHEEEEEEQEATNDDHRRRHHLTLSLRVIVDHSIVESFAQGGRAVVTSRVYPTEAIYAAAGLFLFNNATAATVTAKTLIVHHMMMDSSASYQHQDQGFFQD
ncbi:hypothetical protein QOZ80_6BG0457740 [Eleusine coracana subsp. coracana]|nr:hypothetical protein QOZ80_6BG0457740 [Eleusine coracana subsp. coracana]